MCYNNDLMKTIRLILFFTVILYVSIAYPVESGVDMIIENLHWLGHASFRLDASKIVYFDPWKLSVNAPKAGIILITHEHYDHFSSEDIQKISTKDTIIIADATVSKKIEKAGLIYKEIRVLLPGEDTDISGIKIEAVASYNINKQFHLKSSKNLGFIVNVEGIKIYNAGDTDFIPEMKDYRCDIALLPVSGTYVMAANEAAQAALVIKPKVAIPMHYADIVGTNQDAKVFQDLLKGKIEVKILGEER
jgi:L-ascorbate metabolism protein UlaG (beta-lactamase superfamily)